MLTLRDVWKAKERIRSSITRTPLLYSLPLSQKTGVPIYLKLDMLQPTGSFKLRGASHMIHNLSDEQRKRGVATFSTGNHGFAVAFAATRLGIRAVVCVSKRVPEAKIEALKSSGAELHIEGDSQDEAGKICTKLSDEEGLTVIPPFDHPEIIAGQGTIGLEILEDLPDTEVIMSGLSGGGLLAGIGLTAKEMDPNIDIVGLSIANGAAMDESLIAGIPIEVPEAKTFADSLLGGIGLDNQYTFPLVQKYVNQRMRVSEEAIAKGMAFLYESHRLVVEGAAAISVGALLDGLIQPKGPTVLVITGNSIDVREHQKIVTPYLSHT